MNTTFTYEFKKRAMEQYFEGISSKEIFRRAGIDLADRNPDYAKDCLKRWRRIVKARGFEGLRESRGKGALGRPKTKGVTDADRIKRLELEVKYLKAENDFLAQLRAKRAESNSGRRTNTR